MYLDRVLVSGVFARVEAMGYIIWHLMLSRMVVVCLNAILVLVV